MTAFIIVGLVLLAFASFLESKEWLHEYLLGRQISKQVVGLRQEVAEGARDALVSAIGYAMMGITFSLVACIFYTYG